jgi:NADH-quinone oxidoreductase subunit N
MTVPEMKAMEERMIADLPWLGPVGALALGAIVAVLLALFLPRGRQGLAGTWAAGVHLTAAALAAAVWLDRGPATVMEGTLVVDRLSLVTTGVLGVAGALAVALARPTVGGTDREGELYGVLTAGTLAGVVLASAADAALLAIALGLSSLSTFILTGYLRASARGTEASLKYYIYGTVSGAVMVYGLSWWFGLGGSTGLRAIGEALPSAPTAVAVASSALVLAGLLYKASAIPLHFWTPDAYDGAPLPVAAYLSVVSKLAAVVALARVLTLALPGGALGWPTAVAVLASASMLLGTVAMYRQRNVVRLLAWSSIGQSGFLLIAVAAFDDAPEAERALLFYAMAYAAANLAAFAAVLAVQRERRTVDLAAYAGLGRDHPWWTAMLVVAFLSLLGLPPLAGFVGKLELFRAAIDAGLAWLAVVGVLATVASVPPYLRVIAPTILERQGRAPRAGLHGGLAVALVASAVLTVAIGVGAEPFLRLAGGG